MAFTWVTIIISVSLMRLMVSGVLGGLYRRGIGLTNLIVVGSGRLGKLMMQQVAASPYLGYCVVGFIHDLDGPPTDFGRFKALGTMSDLDAVIRRNRVTEVIIALPSHQHKQILRTVTICERAGANFKLVPDLYELSLSRIDVDAIEGVPLIGLKRSLKHSWQYGVKRVDRHRRRLGDPDPVGAHLAADSIGDQTRFSGSGAAAADASGVPRSAV